MTVEEFAEFVARLKAARALRAAEPVAVAPVVRTVKKRLPRKNKAWTRAEDNALLAAYAVVGKGRRAPYGLARKVARQLGRSEGAVCWRYHAIRPRR